jgi:hypothetical protein
MAPTPASTSVTGSVHSRLGPSLVVVALVVALASSSEAANWSIDLYGDAEMSACSISYSEPTVIQVHFVQVGDAASLGINFAVYPPDCLVGANWVADVLGAVGFYGSTVHPDGLQLAYGACVDMPHYIGFAWWVVRDPAVLCCDFVVSAPKNFPLVAYDCDAFFDIPVQIGKKLRINPDDTCPCDIPIKTEETSWGRIKAFYR